MGALSVQFRKKMLLSGAATLLVIPALVPAQEIRAEPVVDGEPKTLATVVVTGTLPGPGLWRVRRGGHSLYILGTITPVPAKMHWVSAEVETILSHANEVIAPSYAEAHVGVRDVFNMSLLARSAYAAIKIPERQQLADLLPGVVFSQWQSLKTKYLPGTAADGIERSRPMFASQDLYYGAISTSGMTRDNIVWERIAEIAEDRKIPVTETKIQFPLDLDRQKYKAGIAALAQSKVDETTCFAKTMSSLEADLETMRQGANAWAIGDLEKLHQLGHADLKPACKETYDRLMGFQQRPGVDAQADASWLAAATAALERNDVTFAVLPLAKLSGPTGAIERFRAAGFEIDVPPGAAQPDAAVHETEATP
jgi:hypothetical protein